MARKKNEFESCSLRERTILSPFNVRVRASVREESSRDRRRRLSRRKEAETFHVSVSEGTSRYDVCIRGGGGHGKVDVVREVA